jgi:beta propeller repeat protein
MSSDERTACPDSPQPAGHWWSIMSKGVIVSVRRVLGIVLLVALLPVATPLRAAPLPWRITEFAVGEPGAEQFAPAVSGALVVWSEQRETGAVLRGKNVLTGAEIDVASGRADPLAVRESKHAPALSGSVVVWQNRGLNGDGTPFDRIMGRDLARPEAEPFAVASTRGSQLRPAISGHTVVWADNRRGNWDIFGYDLAAQREFVVTTRPGDQLWPAISGDVVVWADEGDGEWRISGKNLASGQEFSLPGAAGNQTAPAISGRLVVWEDTRAGRNVFDVYGYDLERQQEFAVSRASDYQLRPAVAGDLIVWEDYRSGERDLWAYDYRAGQEFAVVVAPGVQWQPALAGGLLVWSDARAGGFTIGGAWLRKGTLATAAPDPAFAALWRVADAPVAEREVQRTWQWGPAPFATGLEDYAEAPGGKRLVHYYDKSRMEITDPRGNPANPWHITTGHLAKELISGQLQIGNDLYEPLTPADIPAAGDLDDLLGPTYASLNGLRARPAGAVGATVTEAIDRAGTVRTIKPPAAVPLAYQVSETNHAIAEPFWRYLTSEGVVRRGNGSVTGRLFDPTFFATGLPITEPYWTRVLVDGKPTDVLIQAFERRVLTYTPGNPAAWRVEMGNVGRHYHFWRYGLR